MIAPLRSGRKRPGLTARAYHFRVKQSVAQYRVSSLATMSPTACIHYPLQTYILRHRLSLPLVPSFFHPSTDARLLRVDSMIG